MERVEDLRSWATQRYRVRTLTQYLPSAGIMTMLLIMMVGGIVTGIRDRSQRGTISPIVLLLIITVAMGVTELRRVHRRRRELLESLARTPVSVSEQARYLQSLLDNVTALLASLQAQVEIQSRVLKETATLADERAREAAHLAGVYEDKARAARALAAIDEEAAAAFKQTIDARFTAADRRNLLTQVIFFVLAFVAGVLTTIWFR